MTWNFMLTCHYGVIRFNLLNSLVLVYNVKRKQLMCCEKLLNFVLLFGPYL